jgi:hypothetical protein
VTRIDEWKGLARRIVKAAQQIFDTADVQVTEKGARDPKFIAMALLARTIGNLEGALDMIEKGKVVEARTLTRCCWENLFWAAALTKKGDEFINKIVADDAFSREKRGKRLVNWSKSQETPRDFESKLEEFLKDYAEKNPERAGIQHAAAADAGNVRGGYIIYGELSTDAAHPSAVSLSRHVEWNEADNSFTMRAEPAADDEEIEQTLEFGCSSMLGVVTAANQVLGYPIKLNDLFAEFQALSNRSKS